MYGVRAVMLLCMLAAVAVSACAHGEAKTIAELPPLDMPAAPPRVVEATEPQQPAVVSLPDEPRTNIRPRPPTPTQRPVDPQRPAEQPKTDQVATEPPRPVEEPPKTPPPTTLQTTPTQREGEVERRVRILIAQAMNDLNRVNYQALNGDARNQYDTAKRFATQAEEALRARNLVFASNLADKAAGLAAQLLGH
jgi:outer membrane biosynthesis protein TonB